MNELLLIIIILCIAGIAMYVNAYAQEPEQFPKSTTEIEKELLKEQDRKRWDDAMNDPDKEGKMFVTDCNDGICNYNWIDPPDNSFTRTSGEKIVVDLRCGAGTYFDITTNTCELTDQEKMNILILRIGLLLTIILIGLIITSVIIKYKEKIIPVFHKVGDEL